MMNSSSEDKNENSDPYDNEIAQNVDANSEDFSAPNTMDENRSNMNMELITSKSNGEYEPESEETEMKCPICYDSWPMSSKQHYPVSLKCGHLFGYRCILEWLHTRASCPMCHKEAKIVQLRRVTEEMAKKSFSEESMEERNKAMNPDLVRSLITMNTELSEEDIDTWICNVIPSKYDDWSLDWWVPREKLLNQKLFNFYSDIQFYKDFEFLFDKLKVTPSSFQVSLTTKTIVETLLDI